MCSRTSSSATTSVGSLAASVSRRPSLDEDQHPEPARDAAREQPHGLRRDRPPGEVDHLEPQLVGQRLGDLPLGDHPQVHQHVTEPAAGRRSRSAGRPGRRQLLLGDHPGVDEHVTQPAAVAASAADVGRVVGQLEPGTSMPVKESASGRPTSCTDFVGLLSPRRPDLARGCPRSSSSSSSWRSSERRKSRVATSPTAIRSDGELAGQVVGVGDVALGPAPVLLVLHPVAVGLAVLGEQDQRRGVGGLQRQHQGERR